jgi:hypothetical protein
MSKLSDVEFDILNSLYFVEPFEKILEEVDFPTNIIAATLKQLIAIKYVTAMKWDEKTNDYVRSFIFDSDDMYAYRYLATKEGLMAHHGR